MTDTSHKRREDKEECREKKESKNFKDLFEEASLELADKEMNFHASGYDKDARKVFI